MKRFLSAAACLGLAVICSSAEAQDGKFNPNNAQLVAYWSAISSYCSHSAGRPEVHVDKWGYGVREGFKVKIEADTHIDNQMPKSHHDAFMFFENNDGEAILLAMNNTEMKPNEQFCGSKAGQYAFGNAIARHCSKVGQSQVRVDKWGYAVMNGYVVTIEAEVHVDGARQGSDHAAFRFGVNGDDEVIFLTLDRKSDHR